MKLTFQDLKRINILFYKQHLSKSAIARVYHVDHSTIIYHLNQDPSKPHRHYKPRKIVVIKAPVYTRVEVIAMELDDKINPGMSYSSYIKAQARRKKERNPAYAKMVASIS